ncbi:cytosolic carboxypeptidase-like protein 5 [Clonorchis sinensis]|uniref:Cytosolic carboxypeptidase-like protein 5 n=1 Tax=Clonorchis sinensis TaxID=79923 RepID=G7Y610_CLOSI|nr:cytosolic carboxypeptidase-like protein 5 [Clonorchis sinensis]
MECESGGLYFSSKFDTGNLGRVEEVSNETEGPLSSVSNVNKRHNISGKNNIANGNQCGNVGIYELKVDYDFKVWTMPDCAGTQFENGNRTWFHFFVRGYTPGKIMRITVMNMNKQAKIYSQGYSPLYRVCRSTLSQSRWQRIRDRPAWEIVDGQFNLTFVHRFIDPRGSSTYFAFSFPWSYTETQRQLDQLEAIFRHQVFSAPTEVRPNPTVFADAKKADLRKAVSGPLEDGLTSADLFQQIYFHRELLCYSLDGRRIDLLTVTDWSGRKEQREDYFDPLLFPNRSFPRPWKFEGKKVVFISSRVHPGETPSSHVFNGLLELLLRPTDARACQLRKQYVFKLIPLLNPDGVVRGHYRSDSRGVNLNRVYLEPDFLYYPSVYATKALMVYHHTHYADDQPYAAFLHPLWEEFKQVLRTPSELIKPPLESNGFKDANVDLNGGETAPSLRSTEDQVLIGVNQLGPLTVDAALEQLNQLRKALHLSETSLRQLKENSGLAFYVDLHGHCSKRGCFLYGNWLESEEEMVNNVLFALLVAVNSSNFDFNACNFTVRNMYQRDRRGTSTKEGSGRVATWRHLGLVHSYTLECNYNTGPLVNRLWRCLSKAPPDDGGRITPPGTFFGPYWTDIVDSVGIQTLCPSALFTTGMNSNTDAPINMMQPRFTPAHYEEVGRALLFALLDMNQTNPWPRLATLGGVNAVPGVGGVPILAGFSEFSSMKVTKIVRAINDRQFVPVVDSFTNRRMESLGRGENSTRVARINRQCQMKSSATELASEHTGDDLAQDLPAVRKFNVGLIQGQRKSEKIQLLLKYHYQEPIVRDLGESTIYLDGSQDRTSRQSDNSILSRPGLSKEIYIKTSLMRTRDTARRKDGRRSTQQNNFPNKTPLVGGCDVGNSTLDTSVDKCHVKSDLSNTNVDGVEIKKSQLNASGIPKDEADQSVVEDFVLAPRLLVLSDEKRKATKTFQLENIRSSDKHRTPSNEDKFRSSKSLKILKKIFTTPSIESSGDFAEVLTARSLFSLPDLVPDSAELHSCKSKRNARDKSDAKLINKHSNTALHPNALICQKRPKTCQLIKKGIRHLRNKVDSNNNNSPYFGRWSSVRCTDGDHHDLLNPACTSLPADLYILHRYSNYVSVSITIRLSTLILSILNLFHTVYHFDTT